MALDGLPEGVSPSGRVPEQLLQAAPILKRRRRRYREEFAKIRSVLGVSTPRAKYRRRGASRGPTRQPGGLLARPSVGPRQGPSWSPGGGPPSLSWLFGKLPESWFLSDFSGIFGALLIAAKPEIQKQQKIATGNWVH